MQTRLASGSPYRCWIPRHVRGSVGSNGSDGTTNCGTSGAMRAVRFAALVPAASMNGQGSPTRTTIARRPPCAKNRRTAAPRYEAQVAALPAATGLERQSKI